METEIRKLQRIANKIASYIKRSAKSYIEGATTAEARFYDALLFKVWYLLYTKKDPKRAADQNFIADALRAFRFNGIPSREGIVDVGESFQDIPRAGAGLEDKLHMIYSLAEQEEEDTEEDTEEEKERLLKEREAEKQHREKELAALMEASDEENIEAMYDFLDNDEEDRDEEDRDDDDEEEDEEEDEHLEEEEEEKKSEVGYYYEGENAEEEKKDGDGPKRQFAVGKERRFFFGEPHGFDLKSGATTSPKDIVKEVLSSKFVEDGGLFEHVSPSGDIYSNLLALTYSYLKRYNCWPLGMTLQDMASYVLDTLIYTTALKNFEPVKSSSGFIREDIEEALEHFRKEVETVGLEQAINNTSPAQLEKINVGSIEDISEGELGELIPREWITGSAGINYVGQYLSTLVNNAVRRERQLRKKETEGQQSIVPSQKDMEELRPGEVQESQLAGKGELEPETIKNEDQAFKVILNLLGNETVKSYLSTLSGLDKIIKEDGEEEEFSCLARIKHFLRASTRSEDLLTKKLEAFAALYQPMILEVIKNGYNRNDLPLVTEEQRIGDTYWKKLIRKMNNPLATLSVLTEHKDKARVVYLKMLYDLIEKLIPEGLTWKKLQRELIRARHRGDDVRAKELEEEIEKRRKNDKLFKVEVTEKGKKLIPALSKEEQKVIEENLHFTDTAKDLVRLFDSGSLKGKIKQPLVRIMSALANAADKESENYNEKIANMISPEIKNFLITFRDNPALQKSFLDPKELRK